MRCRNRRTSTSLLLFLPLPATLLCAAATTAAGGEELLIRRMDPGIAAKDAVDDLACNSPAQGNACLGIQRSPNLTIVDSAETRDEFTITNQEIVNAFGLSNCVIRDLNAAVVLTHSDVGDLIVELERNNLSQDLYFPPGACNATSLDAIFDDEGPGAPNTCPAVGIRLRPEDPLSVFDGLRLDGAWELKVADVVDLDSGMLQRWGIAADVQCNVVASGCTSDGQTLCLANDRFRVRATWRDLTGASGVGQAFELTPDTGYFWFFSQSNVEVVLKVLDACGVNGHFWVFAGGLTNVEVEIRVTDTVTSMTSVYTNPLGAQFQPIQDVTAFATCP